MILASDWIAFHADRTPEKLALIDQHSGRRFTYGQLNTRAARLAGYLRAAWDVQPGDRLAILGKNSTEYFEFEFACIKLGAMMLPLNWRLAEPELLFILNDAEAKGIVYDAEFSERLLALVAGSPAKKTLRIDLMGSPIPDDGAPAYEDAIAAASSEVVLNPQTTHDTLVTIMYTAGTTGHPKGVLITHGMLLWNAINITTPTGLSHKSVFYCVLPTFHSGGLNLYVNPLLHLGGTSIIARQYDPALTLQTLTDPALGVTHMFGVPSIYLFLSQHPDFEKADLRHIESWGCGGAPMPVALLQQYAAKGLIVQLGFGMTETSPTVFLIDKHRSLKKPASVGKPLLHTRVRVVREDFSDVQPGEIGEVVISGPNITPGYWKRPDANASSFTLDAHGNRWLHSGDAGTVDEEGCIYIVDRYKDMYISGGENVYPAEVEQVIFHMPEVADVAVIGVPDDKWGESGLAIIVVKPGCALVAEQVIEHCKANLAKFKVPKSVAFTDVLPRNAAGKVLKRELRAQYLPLKTS
ncbi:MAG: long-chain fatty acid--CoA ligase [Chloroflexi bacterium]|nr:long-chain fatty acid--CoA ligase [Chloroflexota bacterium]